jgi:hypothetical protein
LINPPTRNNPTTEARRRENTTWAVENQRPNHTRQSLLPSNLEEPQVRRSIQLYGLYLFKVNYLTYM